MKKELKKRIHDEENGFDYVLVGDYYVPDTSDTEETRPIGKWGTMHLNYLEEMDRRFLNRLILEGRLNDYLATINQQAGERFEVIVREMMENEGVTDGLKKADQMKWIRSMNSIIDRAEELVLNEVIYN